MTNISNFTISENMNARLAEYGLTSAMAEENGWISCDAAAIQTLLGYLPDCEGREISGLQIPFRSPFTSEILTGEDGRPYSGVFLLTPAKQQRQEDGWISHTDWLQPAMRFGGHVYLGADACRTLQASVTQPIYLVSGAVNAEALWRYGLPAMGIELSQLISPEQEVHPAFERFFSLNPRDVILLLSTRQQSPDIALRLQEVANVLLEWQCSLRLVHMPDDREPGQLLVANGEGYLEELCRNATVINPRPQVLTNPQRLEPVAQALGNAARHYAKVFRMTPWVNQNGGVPVVFDSSNHSFQLLRPDTCPALFESIAEPVKLSARDNSRQPDIFSSKTCKLIIEHPKFSEALNPLVVCSPVPVLTKSNGELRLIRGYDRASGIYAAGEVTIPSSLEEAVAILSEVDACTAFVSEGDRSRAMAHILAPALAMGGLIESHTPILFVEADDSQSGKGKKNKRTAAIYNTIPRTVNQTGGRGVGSLMEGIDAALISGVPIITIDNLDPGNNGRPFHSQKLCSFMTEDCYNARAAYMKNTPINPKRHIIMLTTNGAALSRDIFNRCCTVRLVKQPERIFPSYPEGTQEEHILHNYPRYLGAVIRVLYAWQECGFPQSDLAISTGFAAWWRTVDAIVTRVIGMQSVYDGYHALEERTTNPTLNWVRDLMRLVERTGNLGRTFTTPELLRLLQENDMWRTTSDTNAFQGAQLHFGRRIHEAFRLQGHENYLEIDSWLLTRGNHLQSYGDGRNGRKEIATYTVRRKPPVTMTTPNNTETGSNASV